jgi:SagB-type dehydrogenase family enzyme
MVHRYHDATKHHFHRFARSLGYLDWATQPDPFRRYVGAPEVALSRGAAPFLPYDDLFVADHAARSAGGVTLERVSWLLRYSMGLSAWKQAGRSRWALRVNPSSGNLHPTEAYVVCRPLDERDRASAACVYHYAADRHVLERRARFDRDPSGALGVDVFTGAVVGLTSIYWREAWKYGERAFRYCQHDTGHAIATLALAAQLVGWEARLAPDVGDADIAALLGLDRDPDFDGAEREAPHCLLIVAPSPTTAPMDAAALPDAEWSGAASALSPDRVTWRLVDEVAAALKTPRHAPGDVDLESPPHPAPYRTADAGRLMLQRRSAVALDGRSTLDRQAFVRILCRLVPAGGPPWSALWWPPSVHLALFVHRVDGMAPGLYLLVRQQSAEAFVRSELQRDFLWRPVDDVPDGLRAFCLAEGDCRNLAARLSCDQSIASDGFFTVAMIAAFDPALDRYGPWFYKHLFWECGVIGQVLYLEAEAAGVRGTGIGCFYDDPVHDVLGIFSHRLQVLYHFAVGVPVEDWRLTTEPGYEWEK